MNNQIRIVEDPIEDALYEVALIAEKWLDNLRRDRTRNILRKAFIDGCSDVMGRITVKAMNERIESERNGDVSFT